MDSQLSCELLQVPFPLCQGLGLLAAVGSLQSPLSLSWAAQGSLPQAPTQNLWVYSARQSCGLTPEPPHGFQNWPGSLHSHPPAFC